MKIWVVTATDGSYLSKDNQLATLAFAKIFRSKTEADERINKLEAKRKFSIGELTTIHKKLELVYNCSYSDLLKDHNVPDISFINSCKMFVKCDYGYVEKRRSNYCIPEKRFTSLFSKAAIFNTIPELIVGMQLRMAFIDILRETLIKDWVRIGYCKDEMAAEKEIENLLALYKGNGMQVEFYQ